LTDTASGHDNPLAIKPRAIQPNKRNLHLIKFKYCVGTSPIQQAKKAMRATQEKKRKESTGSDDTVSMNKNNTSC
jgi:hypothetical protein